MPRLAAATDYACVSGWNLTVEFQKRRLALVQVAKLGYRLLAGSGQLPQPDDCVAAVVAHLMGSSEFATMMKIGNVQNDQIIWDMLAVSIARILLDEEWPLISK